jgi:hypothetical protein
MQNSRGSPGTPPISASREQSKRTANSTSGPDARTPYVAGATYLTGGRHFRPTASGASDPTARTPHAAGNT